MRHRSLTLAQILKYMNIYSNNEMAEMLATSLGGSQVVRSLAAEASEVPVSEIHLINGSGLGVDNRISPRAACAMLQAIQHKLQPLGLTIGDIFPVSGRDRLGTLVRRHIPAAAVVKTGTLRNVSALAGVLPTRDRGLVWFAIINRGNDVSSLRVGQDRFLQMLLQQWGAASIPPKVVLPSPASYGDASRLGAPVRNQILFGG
ncbi:D-alanyl-D-alanine carboxypeptidase [Argonema antarcticum]|uniref:D-alanyl-D-alanine carboxypeptidase n=1 Tax=Argonema antarcticum TaxID=2942763 RepID=UPI00308419D7